MGHHRATIHDGVLVAAAYPLCGVGQGFDVRHSHAYHVCHRYSLSCHGYSLGIKGNGIEIREQRKLCAVVAWHDLT